MKCIPHDHAQKNTLVEVRTSVPLEGKAEIMSLVEPGHPKGAIIVKHNNNVTTIAAGVAVLEQVWAEEAVIELFNMGEWLHQALQSVSNEAGSILRITGARSLMTLHLVPKRSASLRMCRTVVLT